MKHKWWHGIFSIWIGHEEESLTGNYFGAETRKVKDETHIFCPICMKKITINNLDEESK